MILINEVETINENYPSFLNTLNYFSSHNHSDYSNFKGRDSICKITNLIDRGYELGYKGVAITDHEVLTGHVKALQHWRKKYKDTDFKVALGDEVYLISDEDYQEARYNNKKIRYNHLILLAKDKKGYEQIRKISSKAWSNWFVRGVERTPITYSQIEEIIGDEKGHLICSTACLGGFLGIKVTQMLDEQARGLDFNNTKLEIHNFITWGRNLFGNDFYIELQPNDMQEQLNFNKMALTIAKGYGIKTILTTDTHYLTKEDREIHKAFLQSEEGSEYREVDEFYNTTYMMSIKELYEYSKLCMDDEDFRSCIDNTIDIYNKIEMYELEASTVVPNLKLPKFELKHLFKDYYSKYEYINKFAYSEYEQDRYFLYLVEQGFLEKQEEFNDTNIARIDLEMSELWELSEALNQRMSAYMNIVQKIVSLAWKTSYVGVSRGSVTGFYTAFLISITQLNPIIWNVPHWRFITKERADSMPDIDIDSQKGERANILTILKEYFGEDNIINISTIKTEGPKSTVLTVCRGLGINGDNASAIASLVKIERGQAWSISDMLYGNEEKERKPIKEFINEIDKYKHLNLKEAILKVEGLINGRSIHAAGVILYENGYIEGNNAIMRSPNGQVTTAYTMSDSEAVNNLKVDCLTVESLDKLRACVDLLIEDKKIEAQETLKATYDKYLHPSVLDYTNQEMWELIPKGSVLDLFQFQTSLAIDCVKKSTPTNLVELAHVNSLLRLAVDDGEQPIDQFVRYKSDINEWYKDMREYGLNEDEIKVLEGHLLEVQGICATQEDLMEMCQNPKIANFDLVLCNKIRKGIAKKKADILEECKQLFFTKGREVGARDIFLNYIWYEQFKKQFGLIV